MVVRSLLVFINLLCCLFLLSCNLTDDTLQGTIGSSSEGSSGDEVTDTSFTVSAPSFVNSTTTSATIHPVSSTTVSNYVLDTNQSNCESGASWTSYSSSAPVTVYSTNALNEYWVKYEDDKGNHSECRKFTVTHDDSQPEVITVVPQTPPSSGLGVTKGPVVGSSNASDSGSGIYKIEVQIREVLGNKIIEDWVEITSGNGADSASLVPGTEYYYKMRVTDQAGNVSSEQVMPSWSNQYIQSSAISPYFPTTGRLVDLDGDGDLDTMAAYLNSVVLIENLGSGQFNIIRIAHRGDIINFSDMDGDGDMDVLIADPNTDDDIFYLRNDGRLQFTEVSSGVDVTQNMIYSLIGMDFDNDTDMDILYTVLGEIRVLENTGSGYTDASFASFGSSTGLVEFAGNINGDSYPDLVAVRDTSTSQDLVYFPGSATGISSGSMTTISSGETRGFVRVEDLDGDTDYDIVHADLTSGKGELFVKVNDGSGSFSSTKIFTTSTNYFDSVGIADYDGDGKKDIFTDSLPEELRIFKQGTGTSFSQDMSAPTVTEFNSYFVYRENGVTYNLDRVRMYTAASELVTALPIGDYVSDPTPDRYAHTEYTHISVGDINGDGKLDLIGTVAYSYAADDFVIIQYDYQNSKDQTTVYTDTSGSQMLNRVLLGDLDGDTDLDIVIGGYGNFSVRFLRNDGSGVFTDMGSVDEGELEALTLANLDGDSDLDLIAKRQSDDYIIWFRNDGSYSFSTQVMISTALQDGIQFVDLDGDLDLDLVAKSSGTVLQFRMFNGTSFDAPTSYTHSANITQFWVADLDGDTDKDVYIYYWRLFGGPSEVHRVINNGSYSSFTSTQITYVTDLPKGQPFDIDGDGDMDLIEGTTSTMSLHRNNGSWGFTKETLSSNCNTDQVLFNDYDADGKIEAACLTDGAARVNFIDFSF